MKKNNFHDFDKQEQGPTYKVVIKGFIYNEFSVSNSNVSLYRPKTKRGDPRIWLSGLTRHSNPNDIISLVCFEGNIHAFNLTQLPIAELINSQVVNPFQDFIKEINNKENAVANELFLKLRKIAQRGLIPSMVNADTSVGRTLETALGIDINSSKKPDYKGIELKSFRSKRGNRKNLFAQVPNWNLSKFKSSSEILHEFGYWRDDDLKLYCTVSSLNANSQGLSLRMDTDIKQLIENSSKPEIGDFIIWTLDKLHSRLLEKHRETFWVEADSVIVNGKEYFQYKEVEHTKKPIISQFDLLIEQGVITLDHLIKKNSKGKVVEKGPIFKIKPKGLDLLFPPSEHYSLLGN
ncbi:MAG: MvaI/BcnI restriction endonuclease family protein [Labilibaculum sp.]|nr:MvaI/BcnI family restriction endonuclease [Labilibaculum sp.]MBI9058397.1 MvaI/BcnI restriction endonuclease family protein [Labilibaculum sp.]